jgi:hypothetical protein
MQREPLPPQPHPSVPEPASVRRNAQQDPVQRERPEAPPPSRGTGKDRLQRENPAPPAWEHPTEAEQFALLYPERVAAGATGHEDIDLSLPRSGERAPPARAAR